MMTYAIADPVVRERENDLDAVFSRSLDNIVQALETLRAIVQLPVALIPNLVIG